jgi:predicted HAD superfamily Cof-like phosphohydrolase
MTNLVDIMSQARVRLVGDFMAAFDASRDLRLWTKLIEEEVAALGEALSLLENTGDNISDHHVQAANTVKELVDVAYVMAGAYTTLPQRTEAYSEADWQRLNEASVAANTLMDSAKFRLGLTDLDLFDAFIRVHRSNMSKLGPDGQVVRREDGKIMKGPSYRPPFLIDLVQHLVPPVVNEQPALFTEDDLCGVDQPSHI